MKEVRPARVEDVEEVASVHVAAWRETYPHLVSERFLHGLDVVEKTAMWRRVIAEHRVAVHVAVRGSVVGFSAVRAVADGPRALELLTLYLLAEHHGSGLGQQLLDAALGDAPALLWVAEKNPRAIAFYARNGFRPDGARQSVPGWEELVEVRMLR